MHYCIIAHEQINDLFPAIDKKSEISEYSENKNVNFSAAENCFQAAKSLTTDRLLACRNAFLSITTVREICAKIGAVECGKRVACHVLWMCKI